MHIVIVQNNVIKLLNENYGVMDCYAWRPQIRQAADGHIDLPLNTPITAQMPSQKPRT
jgi:hypothetical protein